MTRRLAKPLVAAAFLLCLLLVGVCFALPSEPKTAQAQTSSDGGATITLDREADFEIGSDGVGGKIVNKLSTDASNAVKNTSVTSVIINVPQGVTAIANSIFQGNTKVTSITFPSTLKSIGANLFENCSSLASVTFNGDLETIGEYAFSSCPKLTSVTLKKVSYIGRGAFNDCDGLAQVTMTDVIGGMGDSVFDDCNELQTVIAEKDIGSIGRFCFRGPTDASSGVSISKLSNVTIKGKVGSIGVSAFSRCISLKQITITGDNCTIDKDAFYNSGLVNLTLNGTFARIYGSLEKDEFNHYSFGAFYKCVALETVTINGDVEAIGSYAFYLCDKMSTVKITGKVGIMEEKAFYYLDGLTKFEVEKNVGTIGNSVFSTCKMLSTFAVKGTIGSIGDNAFFKCERLSAITINMGSGSIGEQAMSDCYALSDITLNMNGGSIGKKAFQNNDVLSSVTIKGRVDTIGVQAFLACPKLETVKIENVKVIGVGAFYNVASIRTLSLPNTIQAIEYMAFSGCDNITDVNIPAMALAHITNAKFRTVVINGGESIGQRAFADCSELTTVTLADTIKSVDISAFNNCAKLTAINLNSTVTWANAGSSDTAFAGSAPTIIAKDAAGYLSAKAALETHIASGGIGEKKATLTYPITLKLYERENDNYSATPTEQTRLYGSAYNVVLKDGIWQEDATVVAPLPEGYSAAKWFKKDSAGSSKDIGEWIVRQQPEDTTTVKDVIELYVHKIAPAGVAALKTAAITYTKNPIASLQSGTSKLVIADFAKFLQASAAENDIWSNVSDKLVITLDSYTGARTLPESLTDAGTYNLKVNLKPEYGAWTNDVTLSVTIAQAEFDLYGTGVIDCVLSSGGSLSGANETIYIFKNGVTEYPSLTDSKPAGFPESGYTKTTVQANNVYTRYTKDSSGNAQNITLGLAEKPEFTVTAASDGASSIGVYTTTFTLTPTNNYKFIDGSANQALAAAIAASQMTITFNPNGTATVVKVWYVVAQQGYLVSSGTTPYAVTGFVFGASDVANANPLLNVGDAADSVVSGADLEAVTSFELLLRRGATNAVVWESGRQSGSNVVKYINGSMPAGKYELILYVSEYVKENREAVPAFTSKYTFTVAPATLTSQNVDDNNFKGQTFTKKFVQGVDIFGDITGYAAKPISRAQDSFWASADYDNLYSSVTPEFRLSSQSVGTYYTKDEFNANYASLIKSGKNATYTVYYKFTCGDDFNEYYSDGNWYSSYYTVILYQELDVPTVQHATYNGSLLLPVLESSDSYSVKLPTNCRNVGTYYVEFTLGDIAHYRWVQTENVTINDKTGTAKVAFVVDPAVNDWLVTPNIVGWTFGAFDTEVNRIRALPKFQSAVSFAIKKADGSAIAEILNAFNADAHGKIDGENEDLIAALNGIRAGDYKLVVTAAATDNYQQRVDTIDFRIGKSINDWKSGKGDLVLPSWIVGQFDLAKNPIVVKSLYGDPIIEIRDMSGKVYYSSNNPKANTLNDLKVGKYLLVARVEGTDDYSALAERTFTIEVLEKVGLPWWAALLIAVGALLFAALIIFILWKKGVFRIVTDKIILAIKTRVSIDATIASVRAAKMMEEGKRSVAEAKRKDRIEEMRKKMQEQRALPPEERAAQWEAKAQEQAAKADKIRERGKAMQAKADKLRGAAVDKKPADVRTEAAATDNTDTETTAE